MKEVSRIISSMEKHSREEMDIVSKVPILMVLVIEDNSNGVHKMESMYMMEHSISTINSMEKVSIEICRKTSRTCWSL